MIAGMYVVRDETPTRVVAMNGLPGNTVNRGTTVYTLLKLGFDVPFYLTNPEATDVPLLPACGRCGVAPGRPCGEAHHRDLPAWIQEMNDRAEGVTNTTTVPVRDRGF